MSEHQVDRIFVTDAPGGIWYRVRLTDGRSGHGPTLDMAIGNALAGAGARRRRMEVGET